MAYTFDYNLEVIARVDEDGDELHEPVTMTTDQIHEYLGELAKNSNLNGAYRDLAVACLSISCCARFEDGDEYRSYRRRDDELVDSMSDVCHVLKAWSDGEPDASRARRIKTLYSIVTALHAQLLYDHDD